MKRRNFLALVGLAGAAAFVGRDLAAVEQKPGRADKVDKTDEEWRKVLTKEQYYILREEGTEPPRSSPLDKQYGKGIYVCAGCELPLFSSDTKYDSGTGWPSFYKPLPEAIETKLDFKLIYPRTEYHCARCGGHQGHVFKDGPPPTGLRYCNNGLALKFVPA